MKTPCLKCGLIHEEPTAICDGYVGLDPDETAGDTRKQAAARIRAILAAVPIEKRPSGRGKRQTESSSTVAEMKPPEDRSTLEKALDRAAGRAADDAARTAEQELPEWRREVSERLESYRQRRERQTRNGANGQSVLEFRVHSKKENGTAEAVVEEPAPAVEAQGIIIESHLEQPLAPTETEAPEPPAAIAPRAMAAAAGASAGRGAVSSPPSERVYAPPDVRPAKQEAAHETSSFEAPAQEFEELAYPTAEQEPEMFAPDAEAQPADAPMAVAEGESAAELPATSDADLDAERSEGPHDALPLSTEPGIVLADSTTLEIHPDAMELEEVVSTTPAMAQAAPAQEPLIAIPPIDTEYWRTAPGIQPDASDGLAEEECGSLTSGTELHAATEESLIDAAAVVEAGESQEEITVPPAGLAAEPGVEPETAYAALAGIETPGEALFSAEPGETEDEAVDPRREALRTASRRSPVTRPERIEISVPQPVFDFSAAGTMAEHPQDQLVPVADLRERRSAGAIDAAILGLTMGAFFLAFHLAGGELSISRVGAAVVLAASFLIYAQYFMLFTVTAGATPGMMLRGLRVVGFDGTPPGSVELAWRAFGGLLSAAAGMLGFIWAAWDEDGLTWHDRISQTYITYAELEAEPIHAPVH